MVLSKLTRHSLGPYCSPIASGNGGAKDSIIRDCAHREEHGRRLRPRTRLTRNRLDHDEAILAVEIHRVWLCVDHDAHTSLVVRHPLREFEHEAQELTAESLPLERLVDRKTGKTEHR